MRGARGVVALVLVGLVISGCATYTWTKAGIEPDAATADLADCQRHGRATAWEAERVAWEWGAGSWHGSWVSHPWHRGPWWGAPAFAGSPFFTRSLPPPGWRFELERRLTDRCMADRGYRLTKDPHDNG